MGWKSGFKEGIMLLYKKKNYIIIITIAPIVLRMQKNS